MPVNPRSPKYRHDRQSNASIGPPILHLRRSRYFLLLASLLCLTVYYFSYRHTSFFKPTHAPSLRYKSVDWSRYAYSQYATDQAYLCNSVMVFEALDRLGSRADRILMYPDEWDTEISDRRDRNSQLLVIAREYYKVKLIPIKVQRFERDGPNINAHTTHTWDESATKFLTFNQTQYSRILHLDSDITLFKHLDDLFLLPSSPVAMMRAHWKLPEQHLTSMLILLEPSEVETQRLLSAAQSKARSHNHYDMDILHGLYKDSAMVLPHRHYGLLSGEFRLQQHENYLGNSYDEWDPDRVLREASLVHFSDWPLPKPWLMWPRNLLREEMPKCRVTPGTAAEEGCRAREVWLELYNDFRKRRKNICALLSVPAPEWPPKNIGNGTG